MRVVIAPDCFGTTMTAGQAARAVATGWAARSPGDELLPRPMSDGGPGFVDVLHAAIGGTPHLVSVTGPLGEQVDVQWLEHDGTGYVESAQACGLAIVPGSGDGRLRPGEATTRGVGELLLAVRDRGLRRAVVGLGGSATTDGGAGLLAALGAGPLDADGAPLRDGGLALRDAAALALPPTARRSGRSPSRPQDGRPLSGVLDGMELVAATDVDNPLLGPQGAAAVFGPQKGADPDMVAALEAALARWADVLAAAGHDVRHQPGAGAAGGLGAALFALGAVREPGAVLVRRLTGLDADLDTADLVLTGEGRFDWQSLRGKVVSAVAGAAAERAVPCVVLAGEVAVGRREAASVGVDEAYAVAEHAGSLDASFADPLGTLAALAEHVAGRWATR
jgi:glycerate 2-kinase